MKADFVTTEQIDSIAADLGRKDYVEEVSYDKPLIALLTQNVKRISFWILLASAIFLRDCRPAYQ